MIPTLNQKYWSIILDLANKAENPELYAILTQKGALTEAQVDLILRYPEINSLFIFVPEFQSSPGLIKDFIVNFPYRESYLIEQERLKTIQTESINVNSDLAESIQSIESIESNNAFSPSEVAKETVSSQELAVSQDKATLDTSAISFQHLSSKTVSSTVESAVLGKSQVNVDLRSKPSKTITDNQNQLKQKEKNRLMQLSPQNNNPEPESPSDQQSVAGKVASKRFKKAIFAGIASTVSATTGLTLYQILIG